MSRIYEKLLEDNFLKLGKPVKNLTKDRISTLQKIICKWLVQVQGIGFINYQGDAI